MIHFFSQSNFLCNYHSLLRNDKSSLKVKLSGGIQRVRTGSIELSQRNFVKSVKWSALLLILVQLVKTKSAENITFVIQADKKV